METYASFANKCGPAVHLHTGCKGTKVLVEAIYMKGQLKASQPGITQLQTGHFSWSGAFICLCSLCHATLRIQGLTSTPITCSPCK